MKTAALIVIGDEILTGKVKDENSFVFAKTIFERGVRVKQIVVIPDEIPVIAQTVAQYSKNYDYVCTSGGVGPTHDDRTFDGVAQAFSFPIEEHQEAINYFHNAQVRAGRGEHISDAQKKMLQFPTPCEVFFVEPLWLPLVVVKNVYVFPGVPFLFESLMNGLSYLFKGGKFYRELIYTDKTESSIAWDLKAVQDQHPTVAIGSYPQMPDKSFRVMITVEGIEENIVTSVAQAIVPLIQGRRTPE